MFSTNNNLSVLFSTINKAKDLGSYSIANLAFSCLIDLALDLEKELHFVWEKSPGNDDDDIYYDLLVVTDGIRSACIPAPLLDKPLVFRSLCKKEVEKKYHHRNYDHLLKMTEEDVKNEVQKLVQKLFEVLPNCLDLQKYLVKKECTICKYRYDGSEIHCAVNPLGYPSPKCKDWEPDLTLGINEALRKLQQVKDDEARRIEYEIERLAEIEYQRRKQYGYILRPLP